MHFWLIAMDWNYCLLLLLSLRQKNNNLWLHSYCLVKMSMDYLLGHQSNIGSLHYPRVWCIEISSFTLLYLWCRLTWSFWIPQRPCTSVHFCGLQNETQCYLNTWRMQVVFVDFRRASGPGRSSASVKLGVQNHRFWILVVFLICRDLGNDTLGKEGCLYTFLGVSYTEHNELTSEPTRIGLFWNLLLQVCKMGIFLDIDLIFIGKLEKAIKYTCPQLISWF